jgi:hypothetical protein
MENDRISGSSNVSGTVLIGDVLRHDHEECPGALTQWRRERNWLALIRWNASPNFALPQYLEHEVTTFVRAGSIRLGSENPWSISHRSAPHQISTRDGLQMKYPIAEYSIRRIRSREEQIV